MRLKLRISILLFISVIVIGHWYGIAGDNRQRTQEKTKGEAIKMADLTVKSDDFEQGKAIPKKYTCDGDDISPQLSWSKPPEGTKELVLIVDDPDAPMGAWVHWVVWGIPPDSTNLPEAVPNTDSIAVGLKQGKNGFGKIGYGGPCPPHGSDHRYFFKLYAVDAGLDLKAKATKWDVLNAIEGHVIAKGELMGKYGQRL
jgi:Raf kinase inhibitor-like YbhB/YbcL family protein